MVGAATICDIPLRTGTRLHHADAETIFELPFNDRRDRGAAVLRPAHHRNEAVPATAVAAGETAPTYRIIVNDLVLPWRIGVRRHEEDRRQRVRINLDLAVREQADPMADNYQEVTCYEKIIERIRQMAAAGHVKLAETVAHKIAEMCLTEPNAEEVTVRVEKLDAVHDAASVGVEITRIRQNRTEESPGPRLRVTGKR
jgi:dihydroneopterin aldolase